MVTRVREDEAEDANTRDVALIMESMIDALAGVCVEPSGQEEAQGASEQEGASEHEGEVAASAEEDALGRPWMIGACLARVDYFWVERDYGLAQPMEPSPHLQQKTILLRGFDVRNIQPWESDIVLCWDFRDTEWAGRFACSGYLVLKKRTGTEWGLGHAWGMGREDPASSTWSALDETHGLVPETGAVDYDTILRSFACPAYCGLHSPTANWLPPQHRFGDVSGETAGGASSSGVGTSALASRHQPPAEWEGA